MFERKLEQSLSKTILGAKELKALQIRQSLFLQVAIFYAFEYVKQFVI
jgi:hypothetical protein